MLLPSPVFPFVAIHLFIRLDLSYVHIYDMLTTIFSPLSHKIESEGSNGERLTARCGWGRVERLQRIFLSFFFAFSLGLHSSLQLPPLSLFYLIRGGEAAAARKENGGGGVGGGRTHSASF